MSADLDLGAPGAPPKARPPELPLRADRPPAIRLRRSAVRLIVLCGAGLLAAALTWAFVVDPHLRNQARAAAPLSDDAQGAVRPTDRITGQPASYGALVPDDLPEPRRLGAADVTAARTGSGEARPNARAPAKRTMTAAPAPGPTPTLEAQGSALFFPASEADPTPARPQAEATGGAPADYAAMYSPHALLRPLSPYEVKAGAIIPAALLTAVDTARAGPVVASVTQNVFDSVSGRHLLVPQGARLIGRHEGESQYGDRRAFVAWDRLVLPNGKSLLLGQEPGLDAQGAVGVRGRADRRLGALLVATLFAGAVTTLGQIARDDSGEGGVWGDAGDAAAIEAARVGGRLIDRELEVRPSIRLEAGAPVQVMITRDLILEPYRP